MSKTYDIRSAGVPEYRSNRVVRAAKINRVYGESCVGIEPDGRSISFDPAKKPVPAIGWHVMFYDDGYVSFCPPESFEKGYTPVSQGAAP